MAIGIFITKPKTKYLYTYELMLVGRGYCKTISLDDCLGSLKILRRQLLMENNIEYRVVTV